MTTPQDVRLAEAVRAACIAAACEAYDDAGLRGLCAEGRRDLAIDAMSSLNLSSIIAATLSETDVIED